MSGLADRVRAHLDGRIDGVDFSAYAADPVVFARDVLGIRLWSHQQLALQAVAQHRRVAWRSCHGAGKTLTVAALAAWYVCTHPGAIVIVTAPSYRQVRSVVWRTLGSIVRNALMPLGGEFLDSPEHGWRFPDGRLVMGFSAGSGEQLAGLHAPRVLVIVDESSGVEAEIYEALKGALTGDSRLFLVGNPTKTSGEFFDAFGRKSGLYHPLHTSAYDVPNVSGAELPVSGLIDQQWLDEMIEDYGRESASFAVRALGDFPTQSADAVITIADIEGAKERWHELNRTFSSQGALEVGVDVARFGDDESVICVRRGAVAKPFITLRGAPTTVVAERVAMAVEEHRKRDEHPTVRIDTVGVGGGVADILRRDHSVTMRIVDVNAGASATSEKFQRTRDELWFCMRDWIRAGGAIPSDPRLEGELVAPTFKFSPAQKIVVESKDDMKKRLKRSPDRADALALAVYAPKRAKVCQGIGVMPRPRRGRLG